MPAGQSSASLEGTREHTHAPPTVTAGKEGRRPPPKQENRKSISVTNHPIMANKVTWVRVAVVLTVTLLAAADLVTKTWARGALAEGHTVDLGPMQLRLGFNSGVAFSFGASLPAGAVLAITGLIIGVLAIFTWRATRTTTRISGLALALILGGAVANFIDRAADGMVTDYLYTGWFPTFNLADVFITGGAVALVLATLVGRDSVEAPETPENPSRQARGPYDD